MPKKGNVKKNVSKQVKKLNNKKGGFGWKSLIPFRNSSAAVVPSEAAAKKQEITLELSKKILNSLSTSQQCLELSTYIITFLKDIMEKHSFKEVTYKTSTDSTDTVNIMHNISKDDAFRLVPQSILNGSKFKREKLQSIIAENIEQSQKHSFAIIKTFAVGTSDHRGSEEAAIKIVFPKSLTFTFVKDIGSKILDDELGKINKEITNLLKDIETQLFPDEENLDLEEEQADIPAEKDNELGEVQIWFFGILKLKYPNIEIPENDIGILKLKYPNEKMEDKIILETSRRGPLFNFLKTLKEGLNAGQEGGKKHSKREILGKVMIIYKIKGDRKEYVRHKGKLITIKDYKALIKQKVKPKKKST